jgi:uracil-DNA glycosylase
MAVDNRSFDDHWVAQSTADLTAAWRRLTRTYMDSTPGQTLRTRLQEEVKRHSIFPRNINIFRSLRLTPLSEVRVVVLGQDPYHGPGQADGLAFSVPSDIPPPPSLRNILKEAQADLGYAVGPDLESWARQGVLLLNTTLTVRQSQAGAHRGWGWEKLTDQVIELVSREAPPSVFLLWGKDAHSKRDLIDSRRHFLLESPHPSPLSAYRGFLGSRPFSQANQFLQEHGRETIRW